MISFFLQNKHPNSYKIIMKLYVPLKFRALLKDYNDDNAPTVQRFNAENIKTVQKLTSEWKLKKMKDKLY